MFAPATLNLKCTETQIGFRVQVEALTVSFSAGVCKSRRLHLVPGRRRATSWEYQQSGRGLSFRGWSSEAGISELCPRA